MSRIIGGVALALLGLIVLAPWASAVLDRGADGSTRFGLFPIGLTAFDPFVWECVRNSLIVAGVVAAGSLALGVGLALMVDRRFWGRPLLWASSLAPIAGGPLLTAIGLSIGLGGSEGWDWLAGRSILGFPVGSAVRWVALAWVGLANGVPIVALAASASLRRVDPAWSDAARAFGASRSRAWRDLVWPAVRPDSARAAAAVFGIVLVDPTGSQILGLRRTLASQLLRAATRGDLPMRAATLAVLAVTLATFGRSLIALWAGRVPARPDFERARRPEAAGVGRTVASWLILAGWSSIALGPIALVVRRASEVAPTGWGHLARSWWLDPEFRTWAANSATTAGLALAFDLLIVATLFRGGVGRRARPVVGLIGSTPALAVGVGVLAVSWLLDALADRTGGDWLRSSARELAPGRAPGLGLVLALAAVRLPMLANAAGLARDRFDPIRVDEARLAGASDRRASRATGGGWAGIGFGPGLLALALGFSNLVPALILTPYSGRRTLAAAVFRSALESGTIDGRMLWPLAAIVAVNAAAFAIASRARVGPLGDWFRG